jgi:hypothetical protein
MVTVGSSPPGRRYFVVSDDSGLTVLNLTAPGLPPASIRVLRSMASRNPQSFTAVQTSGTFVEDSVRVGRDGVFVADRKVADLGQVVETIARKDVTEITGPVAARGSVAATVLGGWLGFSVGVVPALGGAPEVLAWAVLIGSAAIGASLGFRWSNHETEGVIYRAP